MVKYKINFICDNNKDINEIFIKVLKKDLKKFLKMLCNDSNNEVTSTCTYLSLQDKEGNV